MDITKSDKFNNNLPSKHPYLNLPIDRKLPMVIKRSSRSIFRYSSFVEALYGRTSLVTQDAVERSTAIATISIIFIIGISISLFVVYRTCYIDYVQRIFGSTSLAGFGNGESIYGGMRSNAQACRYDMGRRAGQQFDESFFVTNVEPLSAYRRQY